MSHAVEVEGDELVIRTDGRVERSPVPEGQDPAMFRHIVAGIDLVYRRTGAVPSIDQLLEEWGGFSEKAVKAAYATPELAKALEIRGISLSPKAGLSQEQLYALAILQDFTDRRSTKAKLEQVGISLSKYRAWMRDPSFARAMSEQAEQNLGDATQMALNKLVANAESGDQRAIEKILEITGRYNPQQQEIQNARTVVLTMMEVIQEELGDDKEKLRKILDRVSSKMQVLTITQGLRELGS